MIKNGIKYIFRKGVRSLLLLCILLAMSTSLLCAFSIQKASIQAKNQVYEKIGAGFTLSNNLMNNLGTSRGSGNVQPKDIEAIEKIGGITKTNRRMSAVAKLKNAQWVPMKDPYYPTDKKYENILSITGEDDTSLEQLFTSNVLKLKEGRHITTSDSHTSLVHETFAKNNNLKVGDQLALEASLYDSDNKKKSTEVIYTTIVGIFSGEHTGNPTMEDEMIENMIMTDLSTIRDLYLYDGDEIYMDATFFTKDASSVEKIIREAKTLPIDFNNYKIQENGSDYAALSQSIESINQTIHFMLIATCVIAGILITTILFLFTNSRKKEIAILLSIGKNKFQILLQFIFEVILIGSVSFIIAYGISKPISQSIGQSILNQSTEKSLEDMNQSLNGLLGNDLQSTSTALTISELDVVVDKDTLIPLVTTSYAIMIGATILASLPILIKKPKDILTQSN